MYVIVNVQFIALVFLRGRWKTMAMHLLFLSS